jgi:hypothetical protein
MVSRFVPVIESNADLELDVFVPQLAGRSGTPKAVARVWKSYRRRGLARFFLACDARALHEDLQRSGAAYLHFLRTFAEPDIVVSRADAFWDAIACGDHACASDMAKILETVSLKADLEYEDDFLYLMFILRRFFTPQPEESLLATLDRMQALCGEDLSPQVELCQALLDPEPDGIAAIEDALNKRIAAFEKQGQALVDSDAIEEDDWATNGQFFVEGLAIIRLVEKHLRLQPSENFAFIPSSSRTITATQFAPNSWLTP